MVKYFLIFVLFSGCGVIFAQENNLEAFVDNQTQKLVYDESKLILAPNTNVFLIPPEHFVVDSSINGFVHPGSATTIQISEVHGVSFQSIEAGMTPEYIESQNYTYIEKMKITTESGQSAVIYFVRFESNGMDYERVMFFTGETNTTWINVNYPLSMKNLIYPAIEACLKSVQN